MPLNDLDEIKEGLKARIVEVAQRCLPRGRREGNEWVAHNPHYDEARKSPALKVALTGNKGAWKDWRSGDKGDVLKLIEFTQGCDFKGALTWARDFLGLEEMSYQQRLDFKKEVEQRKVKAAEFEAAARSAKLARAKNLFVHNTFMLNAGSGPEAHARAYFKARGCALEAIENLPVGTFCFSAETEWWKGAQYARNNGGNRKTADGPLFPAVHSAMRSLSGALTCCHVTFLDPVLPQKAPVAPPKLMYGIAQGSVIEVSTGPHGLDFWRCTAPAPLILCEGIETALSLAVAVPEARVWAAGSLSGMGHAPIGLSCISDVTLARDNNHGNAQAQKQLDAALVALEAHDKPLVVMNSHVGDDFNDLMTGKE
jgi:Toprim domain